jgi:patatin-like phospholipase/acyl hydrolase
MPAATDKPSARFRILAFDGGGIRGLISVLVLAEIERRLQRRLGRPTPLTDHFHLFAGTSTGGLITLALTSPTEPTSKDLADFYTEDGPRIFHRDVVRELTTLWGWAAPKYAAEPLRRAIEERLGTSRLSEARRDVLVTSYDMHASEPHFFKRWRALEDEDRDPPIVDAALSTSAAPTYFPSHGLGERVLVDGGVFANDPAVAAIAEALGRESDPPAKLVPDDLFMVSIGTGEFETGHTQREVSGWGKVGWVTGGEGPPILDAMMSGAADGADYWAHMLLNHAPGETVPRREEMGTGPRYYRLQVKLTGPVGLDDASREVLDVALPAAAERLITQRSDQIDAIVEVLAEAPPIPPGP